MLLPDVRCGVYGWRHRAGLAPGLPRPMDRQCIGSGFSGPHEPDHGFGDEQASEQVSVGSVGHPRSKRFPLVPPRRHEPSGESSRHERDGDRRVRPELAPNHASPHPASVRTGQPRAIVQSTTGRAGATTGPARVWASPVCSAV